MTINVPYEIGEKVVLNGQQEEIKGIHVFIGIDGDVKKWRFHVGNARFITIANEG